MNTYMYSSNFVQTKQYFMAKTFKELFAGTGIEPTTDENGGVHYNFNATLKKEPMKTAMQELLQILESKILPCDDDNSYVYGMNVAHANLIYNIKNGFLEKEKEQFDDMFDEGFESAYQHFVNGKGFVKFEDYYEETFNQTNEVISKSKL